MSGLNDKELASCAKRHSRVRPQTVNGFINPEEFHAVSDQLDGDVSRENCMLDFDVADT